MVSVIPRQGGRSSLRRNSNKSVDDFSSTILHWYPSVGQGSRGSLSGGVGNDRRAIRMGRRFPALGWLEWAAKRGVNSLRVVTGDGPSLPQASRQRSWRISTRSRAL